MRSATTVLSVCALVAVTAAEARVLGTAVSDSGGNGTIRFSVDPKLNPHEAAEQISENLSLTNGASLQSVEVKECWASAEFGDGAPGKKVLAEMPDQIADRLGECVGGAAAAGDGGISVPAILGGAAVVGGAIYAAVELTGTDDKTPVGTIAPPSPPVQPPGIPPPPPPGPPGGGNGGGGAQPPPSSFQ